jgi:hypothetical protein
MKYWVTKYALTKGIFEAEVDVTDEYAYQRMGNLRVQYRLNRDCHETWDDALFKSDEMRNAKIASLRKQIAKLEKLKFAPPEDRP